MPGPSTRADVAPVAVAGSLCLFLVLGCTSIESRPASRPALPTVASNENRVPAGTLRDGVVLIDLDVLEGIWEPEHLVPSFSILAFAETGRGPTNPGPLIRVVQGTPVQATIHNRTARDLWIHGLHARPGRLPPLRVPAQGQASVRFETPSIGTYDYFGTLGTAAERSEDVDSQLTGALVVDAQGAPRDDRIFVIGRYGSIADGVKTGNGLGAWVINGKSWPDTERLTVTVGQAVRWRWINATGHHHPLHLHGAFFRVTSTGDGQRDTPVAVPTQVVTEDMPPGTTLSMTWTALRPGNWLFHCHNLIHVMPDNRLQFPKWYEEFADLPHDQHMAGLVLGIHALPGTPPPEESSVRPRRITLRIAERPGLRFRAEGITAPALGYSVGAGEVTVPGPPLILERGRPVEVTVLNGLHHSTSVHWHGIELDSYNDGVPHFGGDGDRVTPAIEPGGSFVARFAPPRAGTFIYHSHFNDYIQLTTGLYGPLIVVDPSHPFSPEVDHVFVVSQGGLDADRDPTLLNGDVAPAPLPLRGGRIHRFRLIGIRASLTARVRLTRAGVLLRWRAVAKDGADLPAALAVSRDAEVDLQPGETYDFEVPVDETGELRLETTVLRGAGQTASIRLPVIP
ncbi:MAG TPA: multicopper oxidase domain-containing protein [Myxococcaceae bacterium]|nr:multicopper oxidase domain-containing protein [Myxococcaceae bacterium]